MGLLWARRNEPADALRTVIARHVRVPQRRVVSLIDQIPGSLFVAGAAVVLGLLRALGLLARVRRNQGGVELATIVFTAGFVVLVIFAVRRRQTNVWMTAGQVLAAIVASHLLALTFVWPFLPMGMPATLASTVWTGLASGVSGALMGVPIGAGGLWLSRRWGSHSSVTERRAREVRKWASGRDEPTPRG